MAVLPSILNMYETYKAGERADEDAQRKTAAYNVLRQTYGDIAGDPEAARQMQAYGQAEQINPLEVKKAQLTNTGLEQTNAFDAANNPLLLQQNTETVREQPLTFAAKQAESTANVTQSYAAAGASRASAAHSNVETAAARQGLNDVQNATAGRIVSGLIGVRDNGGDPSAAYARLAPTLIKMGIIPADRAAPLGAAIKADPKMLDQLSQMLGGGVAGKGMVQVPASDDPRVMTSVPASSMPKAQPGVQYTFNRQTGMIEGRTISGTPQGQKYEATQHTADQQIARARMQFNSNEVRFGTTQQNIDQALQNVGAAGLPGVFHFIPGSAAANLKASLNSVHSDIVNNVIQTFKESTEKGQASGVGRVMQSEIKLWQDAYAATQQTMSPTILKANLLRLKDVTARLQSANRLYNKSVYGFDPTPAMGNGSELPGGFKYLGTQK